MQHDTADDLHREVFHAKHTPGGFTAGGERFRKKAVQRSAVSVTFTEQIGLAFELSFAHVSVDVLQIKHLLHDGLDALEFTVGIGADDFIKNSQLVHLMFLFCAACSDIRPEQTGERDQKQR